MTHPNYDMGINVTTLEKAQKECSKFITSFVDYTNLFSYLSNFDKLVDAIGKLGTPPDRFMIDTIVSIMQKCKKVIERENLKQKANIVAFKKNSEEATIGVNAKVVASNKPLLDNEVKTMKSIIALYNNIKQKLGVLFGASSAAAGGGGSSAAAGGGGSAPRSRRRKQRKQRKTRRH